MTVAELSEELARRAQPVFQGVWRSQTVHPPTPVPNREDFLEQTRKQMTKKKGYTGEMIEKNIVASLSILDRREAGFTTVGLFEGYRRGDQLACRSTWETDGQAHDGITTEWFSGDLFASSFEHPENPTPRVEVHRIGQGLLGKLVKFGPSMTTPQGPFLSPLFWAAPLRIERDAQLFEGESLVVETQARETARACAGDRTVEVLARVVTELHPETLQIRRISRYVGVLEKPVEAKKVSYDCGFPCRVVRKLGERETVYQRVSFGLDPDAWLPLPTGVQVADWRFGPKSGVFYQSSPDFLTDDEVLNTMPPVARAAFRVFQRPFIAS